MELKRILARDSRSATEKAKALYGSDVLVIATHPVDGQTELIVAVDSAGQEGPPPAAGDTSPAAAARRVEGGDFEAFDIAMQQLRGVAPQLASRPLQLADPPAAVLPVARTLDHSPGPGPQECGANGNSVPMAAHVLANAARDRKSSEVPLGREIVDAVRQEIAVLRQELKLARQLDSWRSGSKLAAPAASIAEALQEIPVPHRLQVMLLDSVKDCPTVGDALQTMEDLLCAALPEQAVPAPDRGIHALCGPSGAGKSLMIARLATAAASRHGAEQIAIIGYNDNRPGAWSQLQVLAAQAGVACFRAGDSATLQLLLDELQSRTLVLIDTPGLDYGSHAQALAGQGREVQLHGVLPADASATSVRQLLQLSGWSSLMLSKVDEGGLPWALLQALMEQALPLSVFAGDVRPGEPVQALSSRRLVQLAVAPLRERSRREPPAHIEIPPSGAKASRSRARSAKAHHG